MTIAFPADGLIEWDVLSAARIELGGSFVRILGYFREDGEKSVALVEQAMRAGQAAAMVIPAHTLKGEARQFGAERLAAVAETIEVIARDCVENRDAPEQALEHVAGLRQLFDATLELLDREASPAMERRAVFGRRST